MVTLNQEKLFIALIKKTKVIFQFQHIGKQLIKGSVQINLLQNQQPSATLKE